jgi:hypothetical protein
MSSNFFNRICFLLAVILFAGAPAWSQQDDEHKAKNMAVLNYVTGWSLDSMGYHPAVYMLLENTSGKDLSSVTIKMQGKFTDIHTLEPTTGRCEIRQAMKPHQQFPVALIAAKEFELPRDTNYWPTMECKAMMRIGSVGDEGTEYLLVAKIDSKTMTQDDAFQKLNEVTSYKSSSPRGTPRTHEETHTKPLIAKADHIKPPLAVSSTKSDLFTVKPLPGLGDDFYAFEKSFGMPLATDAKKKDYTWAKYRHSGSGVEIIVGSKERTGKADLIAFVLPRSSFKNDQALVDQCKLFCTSQKGKLGSPTKSVRYLPSGRLELLTAAGPGLKIVSMALPDSPDRPATSNLIMISRLGQDPDELLRSHQASSDLLKSLPLGDSEKN